MAEFIIGQSVRKLARRHPLLQRVLWRLDLALVWTLVSLFRLLPVDVASNLGSRVGRLVGPRMQRKQALFEENFSKAFPDFPQQQRLQLIDDAWGQVGRVLAEYPHLGAILKDDRRLEVVQQEPLDLVNDGARPRVYVTAHVGNWELVCTGLAKLGISNTSLYSPPTNPHLDRMLAKQRKALNCELIPRENCTRPLMRTISEGGSIGLVIDRRVDEGKPIDFFGEDKTTSILAAKLALKYGIDLVPVRVERKQGAAFKVTYFRPIQPANPDAPAADQACDMIQQLHSQFEEWIRSNPADWFCSKRLWFKVKRNPIGKKTPTHPGINSHAA